MLFIASSGDKNISKYHLASSSECDALCWDRVTVSSRLTAVTLNTPGEAGSASATEERDSGGDPGHLHTTPSSPHTSPPWTWSPGWSPRTTPIKSEEWSVELAAAGQLGWEAGPGSRVRVVLETSQ